MCKVENYHVVGFYYDARKQKNEFSKRVRAISETNAREKAIQDVGSKQKVEKRRVVIKSVKIIE